MKAKKAVIKSITSWRTTLIGIILLLTALGVWFIEEMPKELKSSVSLMLLAAALTALGIRDEVVFGKSILKQDNEV